MCDTSPGSIGLKADFTNPIAMPRLIQALLPSQNSWRLGNDFRASFKMNLCNFESLRFSDHKTVIYLQIVCLIYNRLARGNVCYANCRSSTQPQALPSSFSWRFVA